MHDVTIGFIGAGQMALALARGLVDGGLTAPDRLLACDPSRAARERFAERLPGSTCDAEVEPLLQAAGMVILAVKPQQLAVAAGAIRGRLRADQLVVSILAGVTLVRLASELGTERVVRVMPNSPCLLGCGVSAYALGPGAVSGDADRVERLMGAVGSVFAVEERLLDAVTGLSGSGPAYVYLLIESLSDGGVRAGLPRALATALAAGTMVGAARMVLETGEHPAVLKDRVASPGGTTIAGLQALEDRGVRAAMMAAVEAASRRSAELGQ